MQVSYASTTNSSAVRKRFNSLLFSIILLSIFIAAQTNAQNYNYRSAGNGNWSAAGTWQVEDPAGSGNWTNALSPPSNPNDTVLIRNGHTVTINTSPTIRRLVVGEGTSGVLQFDNTSGRVLTVGAGGVTIASGGQFNASGTQDNGNDTHTLTIQNGGSLTNDGTISFRIPDGAFFDIVNINLSGNLEGAGTSTFNNITFNGTSNQTISIGGTIYNIQAVTYNNTGTAPNNQITNQSTTFTTAINPGTSTFTQGNYRHDNTGTYNVSTGTVTFGGADMTVTVLQGTMNFATGDNVQLNLNGGDLIVNGSTAVVNVGGNE